MLAAFGPPNLDNDDLEKDTDNVQDIGLMAMLRACNECPAKVKGMIHSLRVDYPQKPQPPDELEDGELKDDHSVASFAAGEGDALVRKDVLPVSTRRYARHHRHKFDVLISQGPHSPLLRARILSL